MLLGGLFFCQPSGNGAGERLKKCGFCRFDEFCFLPKKIKTQKNENFYKKPLTNARKDAIIVNCIIIARIAGTLVKQAKCVIVKLHKHRMSKSPATDGDFFQSVIKIEWSD